VLRRRLQRRGGHRLHHGRWREELRGREGGDFLDVNGEPGGCASPGTAPLAWERVQVAVSSSSLPEDRVAL
jgi:hypothetical protein